MTSAKKTVSQPLLLILAAVCAFAAAIVLVTAIRTDAASFNPAGTACLDDASTVDPDPFTTGSPNECDGNSAPGAASAITTTFGVGSGDANFGGVVAFTPPEWMVPADADVPDGTLVAQLKSKAVLGLLNSSCSTALDVEFDLMDATTNRSDTVLFNEPNKPASDSAEQFQVVGGLPRGVTEYPDYLERVLWEDNENTPLQLRARLYGQTNVSGVWVSLNFAIFDPGTTIRGDRPDPALGYPSVTLLNNAGDPDIKPAPSAITDFCSPLRTSTTTFATGGGATLRSNPKADGTYNFTVYTVSQRDADGDGFENSLDTCPYDPNPNWDPRAEAPPGSPFPGDSDRDGIPDDCDPLPNDPGNPGTPGSTDGGAVNDHDGDNYYNRQDNCPFVRNNLGIEYFIQGGTGNQTDRDSDGIGDDCDDNPDTPDGEEIIRCVITEIEIGNGGEAPPTDYFPCGTRCSEPGCDGNTPGSPTPTLPPGATPRPTTGINPPPSTGVGSLAPTGGNLPLWAVAMVGVAWLGIVAGGFVVVRGKRD